jgi:hypothetical protein
MSMTQEMRFCIHNTSSRLVKVTTEKLALDLDFTKVKKDHDEAAKKV